MKRLKGDSNENTHARACTHAHARTHVHRGCSVGRNCDLCVSALWGTADAEIKVPSVENPEPTSVLPSKPGVGQNIEKRKQVDGISCICFHFSLACGDKRINKKEGSRNAQRNCARRTKKIKAKKARQKRKGKKKERKKEEERKKEKRKEKKEKKKKRKK